MMRFTRYVFWFAQLISFFISGLCLVLYSIQEVAPKYNWDLVFVASLILFATAASSILMQPGLFSGRFWTKLSELDEEKEKVRLSRLKLEMLQQKYLQRLESDDN
jgi:hypothetical protein